MRRLHSPDDLAGLDDPALAHVIRQRFAELSTYDDFTFDELAEFWLIKPGDTIQTLEEATRLPIINNRGQTTVYWPIP